MGGARGACGWRVTLVGTMLGIPLCIACATGTFEPVDGRFHHRVHGYSLAEPETVVAYRRHGSALMSLQSGCRRPLAGPQVMARHLVIGLPERTLRQAGPVAVGNWPGWTQTFDTLQEGTTVRVKTVTLTTNHCAIDWILTAAEGFEAAEPSFDRWWSSFRVDPEDGR
jgi:hypothetical protein